MSGERSWWLPTAVFVAPVSVAMVVLATVLDAAERGPGLVVALLVIGGFVAPIVDLGRRERRARREGRLALLSADARKSIWAPLRPWPVASSVAEAMLGAGMLAAWPWLWANGIDTIAEAFAPMTGLIATWSGWSKLRKVTRSVA